MAISYLTYHLISYVKAHPATSLISSLSELFHFMHAHIGLFRGQRSKYGHIPSLRAFFNVSNELDQDIYTTNLFFPWVTRFRVSSLAEIMYYTYETTKRRLATDIPAHLALTTSAALQDDRVPLFLLKTASLQADKFLSPPAQSKGVWSCDTDPLITGKSREWRESVFSKSVNPNARQVTLRFSLPNTSLQGACHCPLKQISTLPVAPPCSRYVSLTSKSLQPKSGYSTTSHKHTYM